MSSNSRSDLVSTLWSLKNVVLQYPESGLSYIHFNVLLRDENYRLEVIERALKSTIKEVQDLALRCQELNQSGSLIGMELRQRASSMPAVGEPDLEEAEKSPQKKLAFLAWGLGLALLGGMSIVAANLFLGDNERREEVIGSIYGPTVWRSDTTWNLKGVVFVESGATLTIEPGTRIVGDAGSALIITRDATLNARGTPERPILFTSSRPVGERKAGDWGGLALLGNAPINTGTEHLEGIDLNDPRGSFGGSDRHDNCGLLQYVRIEFAGHELSANNELNGLTLAGCGEGTVVRFVQIHRAMDDGLEIFGGTVNIRNILITYPGDDGLDWDRGWQGKGQFVVVNMASDRGDSAIEADNYSKNHAAEPRSKPILSNVTLLGSPKSTRSQRGMVLRHGTSGDFRNFIIADFVTESIDIRDSETVSQVNSQELKFSGLLVDSKFTYFSEEKGEQDDDYGFRESDYFSHIAHFNPIDAPSLFHLHENDLFPNYVPLAEQILESYFVKIPQGEFWDEAANFIGAVRPSSRTTWMDPWVAYPAF